MSRWIARRWVTIVVVVIGVWVLVVALQLFRANRSLHQGLSSTDAARAQLASADIAAGRALPPLQRAHSSFRAARRDVRSWPVAPLRIVPIVGRQVRSVDALSTAAANVTAIGGDAFHQLQGVLGGPHSSGPERVALLRDVAKVSGATEHKLAGITLGPTQGLVGPLAHRRDEFQAQLDKLRIGLGQGAAAADGLADMLGGPRTYLLLAANNAEMRSGSGMFLNAGTIHAEGGHLTMGPISKTAELTLADSVPISGDLEARWGSLHPGREWRNLNLSPAFDVSAEVASRMWVALGNPPVDGVIALDVGALREVLAATGPVAGPSGPINADNVEQFLLHDQYLVADPYSQARVEMLGAVGAAALTAAESPGVDVFKLGSGLARAAQGRRVLLWSADPAVQRDWVTAGVSGALRPDTLLVSVENRGGNKLDRFLDVRSDLSVVQKGGTSDVTVHVTLTNRTPAGEPTFIAGPGDGVPGPPGRYIGLLAANVPGSAGRLGIDSLTEYAAAGRDGPTLVVSAPVSLDAGQSKEYTIHFQLGASHGEMVVTPSARIPGVSWQAFGEKFVDESPRTVRW